MAATYNTYYFDGINFSSATALYSDAALTTLAPDGFYAQNGIVRQQTGGLLLNAQSCTSCAVACGSGISASNASQPGYYNADIDVANSIGAVVVYFYMGSSVPDGVLATFNNVTHNRMTSKNNHGTVTLIDGAQSTVDYAGINNVTTLPTYVGNQNDLLVGSYFSVPEFNLSGGAYVDTGNTRSINVVNNQVGYASDTSTPSSPVFTMVIPKTDANTTLVKVETFAPMTGTFFAFELACPEDLPNFQGSALQATDVCTSANVTYYFARNASGNSTPFTIDTNTVPEVGNFVFTDANGATYLNDTNTLQYIIVANTTSLGIRNGVVVSSAACSSGGGGYTSYTSSSTKNFGAICNGGAAPALNQTYYHGGAGQGPGGIYPSLGDSVYSDASGNFQLSQGYYYLYQDGSGDANYIQVGGTGTVILVSSCTPPTTTFFISGSPQLGCATFCSNNYTIGTTVGTTNNHSYLSVTLGDVIAGATLGAGWYAYAEVSTTTSVGTFRQMQLDSNNAILSLAECSGGSCVII